jgi:hypothetical protein
MFSSFFFLFIIFLIGIVGGGWSPIGFTQHCGQQWPIVPAPNDYDDGENGEMIGRGNRSILGENLLQCRFAHHKSHMLPRREPGPPRWESSD